MVLLQEDEAVSLFCGQYKQKEPSFPRWKKYVVSFFVGAEFYWHIVDLQCCVSFRYISK